MNCKTQNIYNIKYNISNIILHLTHAIAPKRKFAKVCYQFRNLHPPEAMKMLSEIPNGNFIQQPTHIQCKVSLLKAIKWTKIISRKFRFSSTGRLRSFSFEQTVWPRNYTRVFWRRHFSSFRWETFFFGNTEYFFIGVVKRFVKHSLEGNKKSLLLLFDGNNFWHFFSPPYGMWKIHRSKFISFSTHHSTNVVTILIPFLRCFDFLHYFLEFKFLSLDFSFQFFP